MESLMVGKKREAWFRIAKALREAPNKKTVAEKWVSSFNVYTALDAAWKLGWISRSMVGLMTLDLTHCENKIAYLMGEELAGFCDLRGISG